MSDYQKGIGDIYEEPDWEDEPESEEDPNAELERRILASEDEDAIFEALIERELEMA